MTDQPLSARSQEGSEIIFRANYCKPEIQTDPLAKAEARQVAATEIACGDCGDAFPAAELDGSTGLCRICDDAGGEYNRFQDGITSEKDLADFQAHIGYKGSDRISREAGI